MTDLSNTNPTSPTPGVDDDDEISLLDLAQVVMDNLRLLIIGPLVAGLLALGVAFVITPTFTATTVFMPPQQQQGAAAALMQSLGGLGGLAGAAAGLKNPNDQFVSLMKSTAVKDALIRRFKLQERYEAQLRTDVHKTLDGVTRITSGKDGLITVEFDDKDPAFAAEVANACVEELGNLLNRLAVTEAQQRRVFFEKQLLQTKKQLTQAEQALLASGVSAGSVKANAGGAIGPVAALQAQITAQQVKLGAMRGYLTDAAPEMKQALTELASLRAQLAKLEQAPDASASTQDAEYVSRYRDFQYYQTLYDLFARQFELAKVDESREGAVIQVVDPATPPERKSKPKRALIAILTTLASGFVLLLFVFVRQSLRNASQSAETASKLAAIRRGWRRALGRGG